MRIALCLCLAPALTLAQPRTLTQEAAPPRGIALPPTSAALVDEATALALNPAALLHARGSQLVYLHERSLLKDLVADGVFLSSTWFGAVGTGLSVEWMRGRTEPAYRKNGFGLSFGSQTLALGATYNTFSSSGDRELDRLSSWDLGVSGRPTRRFSYGLVAKDVNAPRRGARELPRRYDVALGLRPFDERLSLGADYLFADGGFRDGRMSYTLEGEVWRGIGLALGFSHGFTRGDERVLQLAATFDTSHLGLTYAGGGASSRLDHVLAVRLSTERYRAIGEDAGKVALLDVDDRLSGGTSPTLALLGVSGADPYLKLMRFLDEAARDADLKGVLLKMQGLPGVSWGRAEELRQAILRLRGAGKRVMVVLLSAQDTDYLVASAADQVYAFSESTLLINGLSASVTSLGGLMEKLGVTWDVARVGTYKTAPEQLTLKEMSPAQRETLDAYLDSELRHYETAVTSARRITPERLREAWATGILTAKRAQELGLLDGVVRPDELDAKVASLVPGAHFDSGYAPRSHREVRWGTRPRIAVVPVVGNIAGGKSREDPLGVSRIAGAETVVRALSRAQSDPTVRAIVLRVDSGGGDVLASDLMYRAVVEARKHKPVIASMGDVAASGGYYAAMGADTVFAAPTTLTGSIGVFFLKPALGGLGDKLGVHSESVSRAPLADVVNLWRPWTPAEQRAVQAWVDASYDTFITEVASSRKLDKAKVHEVAQGRVWSGADAKARGLVDRLGGMLEAVDAARDRAGIRPQDEVDLVVLGDPSGPLASLGGEPEVVSRWLPVRGAPAWPAAQALLRDTGLDTMLSQEPGLKALLPFSIRVH